MGSARRLTSLRLAAIVLLMNDAILPARQSQGVRCMLNATACFCEEKAIESACRPLVIRIRMNRVR